MWRAPAHRAATSTAHLAFLQPLRSPIHADTEAESECGAEGKEACLGQDGAYSCTSPVEHEGVNITVTAARAGTDSTLTLMCEACGKSGLRACKCSSLPPGTCAGQNGNAYYCEGDEGGGEGMYLANEMLFCS